MMQNQEDNEDFDDEGGYDEDQPITEEEED